MIQEFEKLTIGPKRPRPNLNVTTICSKCGSKLTWKHMLKRHQATPKCLNINKVNQHKSN